MKYGTLWYMDWYFFILFVIFRGIAAQGKTSCVLETFICKSIEFLQQQVLSSSILTVGMRVIKINKFSTVMTSPGPAFQECTGSCYENLPASKAVSSDLRATDGVTALARIEIVTITILQHFTHNETQ